MSYQPGDAHLVTEAIYRDENFLDPDEAIEYMPYDSRSDGGVKGFPYVKLPHSCDAWVIGTKADVKLMIAELQAILDNWP